MFTRGGTLTALTGLFTGLLISFTAITSVHAATTDDGRESIALSPVSKSYKFDAGTTHSDSLTVINDGTVGYDFKVYAAPYSVTGEDYKPDFFTTRKNTDIESWVKFEQTTYTLEAGESLKLPYTVEVPADATPGGHYGVIFVETQPKDSQRETSSVERKKRIGTLLYATVNGTFEMGGTFKGIRTPGLQFTSPLKSELNVENTGNSDFQVETVLAVSDLFGNRKFTDTKKYQLLPKTERKIVLTWDQAPGFGFYEVTTSAKFLDQQTTRTSYVLMAPIGFYMIFALGLLVAVVYFVQRRR